VAFSGRKEGWRQFNALMATARRREIDCALVRKFDHLGVRFVSVQDQVDTISPMGRAMFTIIGAVAELESLLISERMTAGMRAAEARSRPLGGLEHRSTSSATLGDLTDDATAGPAGDPLLDGADAEVGRCGKRLDLRRLPCCCFAKNAFADALAFGAPPTICARQCQRSSTPPLSSNPLR
jgi:hypothetical protein